MDKQRTHIIARFVTVALFTAVIAGTWDAWWHGTIGRESFWSPPHILLYTPIIASIIAGVYGWYKTKDRVWRQLALVLVIVPLSAPFDELWHRTFGIESVASPLIVWSPPHVALIAAIFASFLLLFPLLRKDTEQAQQLFGAIAFAALLSLLLFLALPLQPTGPYALLGFWGAGVIALFFIGIILAAQRSLPGIAPATLMIIFFVLVSAVGFGEKHMAENTIPQHDHPPGWLNIFSTVAPALFVDLARRMQSWVRGAFAGFLSGGILYSFASYFFESQFQYGFTDAIIAIIASVIGGLLAGIIISLRGFERMTSKIQAPPESPGRGIILL